MLKPMRGRVFDSTYKDLQILEFLQHLLKIKITSDHSDFQCKEPGNENLSSVKCKICLETKQFIVSKLEFMRVSKGCQV